MIKEEIILISSKLSEMKLTLKPNNHFRKKYNWKSLRKNCEYFKITKLDILLPYLKFYFLSV